MKKIGCAIISIFIVSCSLAQTTYYSRNTGSGGDWNLTASWTLSSDGSGGAAGPPTRTDDITILNGHTITVNNKNDNGSAGVSASATYTVGGFAGAGNTRFYQNGLVTVDAGGTLTIAQTDGIMFEDTVYVHGTVTSNAANTDFLNAGYMHVYAGGTLDVGDDLILIDNSETILDDIILSADDIYMDGTTSFLCGDGSLGIGGAIQEFNSADANQQICDTFVINCIDGNCCDEGTTVASCAGNSDDGSFGGGGGFVLPVELLSFSLKKDESSVILEWSTTSELNNDYFTLEWSSTGVNFSAIGQVKGNGTISQRMDYTFIDNPLSEVNFYLLSQTDFDGTSEIFEIRSIHAQLSGLKDNLFYPNPANNIITSNVSVKLIRSLTILDMSGKAVSTLPDHKINQEIDVSSWKNGMYLVLWTDIQNISHSQRLLIK